MEQGLFSLKYRLRKTDESVEVIAWETVEKGARSENDWVSYIDSKGVEHIKEQLTLEWDFVAETPFGNGLLDAFKSDLPKFDMWEARRYDLAKEFALRGDCAHDAVEKADFLIAALKPEDQVVEGVQMDDGYDNIGIGEIVEYAENGLSDFKKFVFTDKKDIVGFVGDSGRYAVGDRVKVYIKKIEPNKGL